MKPSILVVEDEQSLADTLALNLKLEEYEVVLCRSGSEALKKFMMDPVAIDIALLDVMLPDVNGHDLCKEFRKKRPNLPVMFLTARNQAADKIAGLKLGADDYITKPFDLEELLLRIGNLLKRATPVATNEYSFANCRINFQTYEIIGNTGQKQTLSRREIGLLELLTSNENKVISRDEIITRLWEENENASSRTIDNYILNFRKYFEKNARDPQHFHSIRGVGYKFTP
jgi:two-component system alkaline phosphatase synthesis response regulator PhoP